MQEITIGDTVTWQHDGRQMIVIGFDKQRPAGQADVEHPIEAWPINQSMPICEWQDEYGALSKAVFQLTELAKAG